MATTPMPVPNAPQQPQVMPAQQPQVLSAQQPQVMPAQQPQAQPAWSGGQQAQPAMPVAPQAQPTPHQRIAEGAKKAVSVLSKAATSLPQIVESSVKEHDSMTKLRDKQVIDLVANAHVAQVTALDKIQNQLQPLAQQIDQHMKEAQALPSDDPTKTGRIGYLAHIHADVVSAIKQQMQGLQQSQQTIQAQMADPKNRKLLSKAVGYDEKQANSPERQMMIAAINAGMQQIQDGAKKAAAAVPVNQEGPNPNITPGSGMAGDQSVPVLPTAQQNVTEGQPQWKHRLAQIATVIGDIAIPGQMHLIPGTPQNKREIQERAIALQEAIAKIQGTQAKTELDRAQAAGELPAAEKEKEFEETLTEKERETKATEVQAAATREATEAYRQATLGLAKAKFDAQQDPNSTQNQFKIAQLKIQKERADAAMAQVAQTQTGLHDVAEMVVNHQIAPSEVGGFGMSKVKVLGEVAKIDPKFNTAEADRAFTYAKNPSVQSTLNYIESLTGPDNNSGNLGILIQMSDALPRGKYPAWNKFDQWTKLQEGNPQIAGYYAALIEVPDQVAKILAGGGTGSATSDAKLQQAIDLFNKGFNPDQMKATATTLRSLLGNRKAGLIRDNPFLEQQFGQGEQTQPQGAAKQSIPAGAPTATDAQGNKIYYDGKAWVPAQ